MEFTSEDKIVISHLLRNGRADLYELHLQYKLSPAQLARSVSRLESVGIAKAGTTGDELTVVLDDTGFEALVGLRQGIYGRRIDWKSVPSFMLEKRQDVEDEHYPNWRKLSREMKVRLREIRKEKGFGGRTASTMR